MRPDRFVGTGYFLKHSYARYRRGAGHLSRRVRRTVRIAAAMSVVSVVIAGAGLAAAPRASAAGLGATPVTAFQANVTGALWFNGSNGFFNTGLGMASGTSPSICVLSDHSREVAFQANTGHLWIDGPNGYFDTGLGLAPGTSPAVSALPGRQAVIAFQANVTSQLWIDGPNGYFDTGLGMAHGTSPSIATMPDGSYEVAFQANVTGHLWVDGSNGYFDTGLAMAPGTSPSITTDINGYEIAYQSRSNVLGYTGIAGSGLTGSALTGLAMDPASSPSITTTIADGATDGGTTYQIAFESNTDVLGTTGGFGTASLGLAMAPGTSPSITGLDGINTDESIVDNAGYHIDFHATTGTLWTYDFNHNFINNSIHTSNGSTGLGMSPGSSPSTTADF